MASEVNHSNEDMAADAGWLGRLTALPRKIACKVVELAKKMKKLGQDDPRRISHSFKVGLAITIVSSLYYFKPLYDGFGSSAMWAVFTVINVFEFSVGATLGKGLNRGFATLLAGALGFGAYHLANLTGERSEHILVGILCLPTSYREEEILKIALQRATTILIGGLITVLVCIFVYPVWAGGDLHNLVATNMEKVGTFLEGFGPQYFETSGNEEHYKACVEGYKNVLNSKQIEDNLANFAWWEPCHGQFRFRQPWKLYLKVGSQSRQCAYRIDALNGYLNSDLQTPPQIRSKIQEPCIKMSSETGRALKELAVAIKTMTPSSSAQSHIAKAKIAAMNLKSMLKTVIWEEINLLEVIPDATVASLLVDIVSCAEKLAESTNELASLAKFKRMDHKVTPEEPTCTREKPMHPCTSDTSGTHHVIAINLQPATSLSEKGNS
ncbi:Aluminum activated malate transporter family protein [Quillaja saponaria]|uniref:Aluminum activated malate transporter family protein n=1 Tax=Quillaja saponaria TaxID=32244 RepID=A0AAD7PAU4_QUISA|nr:Aluminum activated malate transporter family protein [Quillaja saponaria]